MGSLITTRDLDENTEYSVQQAHSYDIETGLPMNQHTKGISGGGSFEGESIIMERQRLIETVIVVSQIIFLVILCVLGTLANGLVFWVFNRRPALRSLSNRFVLSLVTSNILISSIIAPLMLFQNILDDYFLLPAISEVISLISRSAIFAAVFSTFLIATDRFFAVTSPLHYSMTITRSRSQIMIILAWLAGIVMAVPQMIMFTMPQYTELHQSLLVLFVILQLAIGYIFPFVCLCWLYLRMYHAAHRNSERTRKHSISGELLTVIDGSTSMIPPQGIDFLTHYMNPFTKGPMVGSVPGVGNSGGGGNESRNGSSIGQVVPAAVKKQRRRSSNGSSSSLLFREEGRAIKTAFFVLGSFFLCWTPHFTYMFISEIDIGQVQNHLGHFMSASNVSITPTLAASTTTTTDTAGESSSPTSNPINDNSSSISPDWLRFFGMVGILMSCILNPFIYVFRNKMACKEASKLVCTFIVEKRRRAKHEALLRERHQNQQQLQNRDQNENSKGAGTIAGSSLCTQGSVDAAEPPIPEFQPQYTPCIGKSPKRSSLKSLTPQSSINSTITNCNSITNVSSPLTTNGTPGILSNSVVKPPFIRSMTVPEQSQPRVKFPPNLIRQKSCIHRPVYGGPPIELTPALSRKPKPKFVRQDSVCSFLSNDSLLIICAEDGVCLSEIGIFNRAGGGGGSQATNGMVGGCPNEMQMTNGSVNSSNDGGDSSNVSGAESGTPLPRNYLRQDSNFSDASHRTNDSGVGMSMCPSKQSSTESPNQPNYHHPLYCQTSRTQSPCHLSTHPHTRLSPKHQLPCCIESNRRNHHTMLQTTI